MSEERNSIADPGPLGLAGFAMTTFVLSMINAKLVPGTIATTFLTLALFYGGIAQILAGMWEFKKNNTFGATAFTSYGAFWLALASIVLFEKLKLIDFGPDRNIAIGLFLVAWTIFHILYVDWVIEDQQRPCIRFHYTGDYLHIA